MLDLERLEDSSGAAGGENPGSRRRILAVVIAIAVVALPVSYLVSYYAFPNRVSATSQRTTVGESQSALESEVQGHPTAENRINLALAYIRANQPGRAVPVLELVLENDPRNPVAWNDLGVANTMLMNYNLGVDDCKRSIEIAPDFELARNNLGWAQDELRKTQQRIEREEQTALSARDESFYLAEGLNLLHIGNYDQAIEAWERALELNPRDALSANNIGTAYMFEHQPPIALLWFQRALGIDNNLQIARNNELWAQSEIARSAQAKTVRNAPAR